MEKIQEIKNLFSKETKTTFLITIITSLIVHFQLYSLMITGPDTLLNNMYHQADIWEAMLLRFGLDFIQAIKGNIVSPVLVTLISSILLGITVVLVTKVLEIKNKYLKYIIAIIFTVAPNISATLTFFYCSDAYILGMLLATLSIFLIRKFENKKWIILISSLSLALAMGMYQTYLSVTMVLAVATLIIDLLNKKDIKIVCKNILKYIIMGILGIIIFYLLSHLTLILKKLSVSNYMGANTIGIQTLLNLPNLLPQVYQSFFNYYFTDNILPNTIWNTNIFYIIIFSLILISIIYLIIKNKIYKKIPNILLIIFLIVIMPICFGIIEIAVPDVDIHVLMACSMIFVFPIFFKILEMLPRKKLAKVLKYLGICCTLVIAWIYIWQDNSSYLAIKSMQDQTEATVLRIVTRIEELEGYSKEMPVLITGGLENNDYFNKTNTSLENKKIFDRSWGFISKEPTIWMGDLDSWEKAIYEYVGVNMNLVSEEESKDIIETEEYKNMKTYPKKDSIKIINNVVVVKLSN